jgi:hypothetical protein
MSLDTKEHAREQLDKVQKMQRMILRVAEATVNLREICESERFFATRDNMAKILAILRREASRLKGSEMAAERYLQLLEKPEPAERHLTG